MPAPCSKPSGISFDGITIFGKSSDTFFRGAILGHEKGRNLSISIIIDN